MPKRLTTSDYERGVHSLFSGWNNIYRMPISAIREFRDKPASGDSK
jgi:hypothetical protein